MYFILYGIGRAWIEALRGDSLYIGAIKVSQLLSILLIIGGLLLILINFLLVKKGKTKSVSELEPFWSENIKRYNLKIEENRQKKKAKQEEQKQKKDNDENNKNL